MEQGRVKAHGLVLAAVALLWPPDAASQAVYKCIGSGDRAVYQSSPCEAGAQTADTWSELRTSPERTREIEARQRRRAAGAERLRRMANRYRTRSGAGSRAGSRPKKDACEAARERRERAFNQPRVHLTYDERDRLDDAVFETCY